MTRHPTAHDAGSFVRLVALSAATATALMSIVPAAFAQASAPVTSSVFVHQPYDTGNSTVNENFQYIAHPPMRPVAASAPAAVHGGHRGRRGQTGNTSATSGGTSDAAPVPLPTMPSDGSSGAPASQ